MTTTTTTVLHVSECPSCGVTHGYPETLNDQAQQNHSRSIYCPNGHSWHFLGETDAAKERRLRKLADDRAAAAGARADQAEASLRTTKGVVTKLRKRAIVGTCAFCHRHFANVERHVASQHPEEREP